MHFAPQNMGYVLFYTNLKDAWRGLTHALFDLWCGLIHMDVIHCALISSNCWTLCCVAASLWRLWPRLLTFVCIWVLHNGVLTLTSLCWTGFWIHIWMPKYNMGSIQFFIVLVTRIHVHIFHYSSRIMWPSMGPSLCKTNCFDLGTTNCSSVSACYFRSS